MEDHDFIRKWEKCIEICALFKINRCLSVEKEICLYPPNKDMVTFRTVLEAYCYLQGYRDGMLNK